MALPPLDDGAVQVTAACPLPATALTPVGAPGGRAGTPGLDPADAVPVPTAFVAVTVNVYVVPFVRPVTVALVAVPAAVAVRPPGDAVTVKPVIALPPFESGAVQVTVACWFPAQASTPVGAPGTVAGDRGVTALDAVEAGPVPTAFVAFTVNV